MPRKRRGGSTPLSPTKPGGRPSGGRAAPRPSDRPPPYTGRAMQITRTPGPDSTIQLEIELPAERLSRAIDEAVRHLARRTKVPGFRPGKAPRAILERQLGPGAVLDDAVEHLVQDALSRGPHPGGHPAADQRRRRRRAGRGGEAAHLQGDRAGPARGRARRLQGLQLRSGDRHHRRRPRRQGPRGAARPERDPRRGRRPRRTGRRLRGHLVRRVARRRAVRGRDARSGCRSSSARSD